MGGLLGLAFFTYLRPRRRCMAYPEMRFSCDVYPHVRLWIFHLIIMSGCRGNSFYILVFPRVDDFFSSSFIFFWWSHVILFLSNLIKNINVSFNFFSCVYILCHRLLWMGVRALLTVSANGFLCVFVCVFLFLLEYDKEYLFEICVLSFGTGRIYF